jgi:hypothetical protein
LKAEADKKTVARKEGGSTPDKILWSRKDKDGKLHSQPTAIAPTQHIPRMSSTNPNPNESSNHTKTKNKDKDDNNDNDKDTYRLTFLRSGDFGNVPRTDITVEGQSLFKHCRKNRR